MGMVFLRRLSRWQAESQREQIADIHNASYRDAFGEVPLERQDFIRRLTDHDVQQEDFDLLLASDPALVGAAYGYRVERDSAWWREFEDVPVEIDELAGSRQVFVVAELMVIPSRRRERVASRMLSDLLARTTPQVALALLEPGDTVARTAYQSWNWTKTGQLTPHDAPPKEVWSTTRAA
ncbi:hypothetical protein ACFV0Z_12455 [Streptomyces xiamenensis]|uniref:hypothetical protein n=1 Tax=Streptomyces xiamenensis TaxID=408015 RepID=UPI00368830DC